MKLHYLFLCYIAAILTSCGPVNSYTITVNPDGSYALTISDPPTAPIVTPAK